MRFVSACTRRTSPSCSRVVIPGLSTMKSLPWRMTSMPSGARSLGMEALTTSLTSGSSRISRSLRAGFACGYRLANAAARSGSLAKNETRSPPPRITESTCPLTWPWFKPIAAKRIRGALGGGALCGADALPGRAAAHATPAVTIDDFRNARRPVPGGAGGEHVGRLLAANLRRPSLAFGPAALRDALALRNHALEDLLLDGIDVVDALEADVHQLDAELGRDMGGLLQDDLRDLAPAHGDRGH